MKNQYLFTVDSIFKTTGQLWEKMYYMTKNKPDCWWIYRQL